MQVKKSVEEFGCQRVTFVGDRGVIKSGQITELKQAGFHYITPTGVFQMELLDNDICKWRTKEYGIS